MTTSYSPASAVPLAPPLYLPATLPSAVAETFFPPATLAPPPYFSWFDRCVRSLSFQKSQRYANAPAAHGAWKFVREHIDAELDHLRGYESEADRHSYLNYVGNIILNRMMFSLGVHRLGFHYNLHGGCATDYLEKGGILATQGDIELKYTRLGDPAFKVYFFDSNNCGLFEILNERHASLFGPRMGNVLVLFDLGSSYLMQAFAQRGASKRTATSIDFDPEWIKEQNNGKMVGIPASTFVMPPLTIFEGVKRAIGHTGWLSRDDETLTVMRYIEASLFMYMNEIN
ncbi:MAG: hypothetical protein ABH871_01675 [Pseudomonadota bacterium]